MVITRGGRMKLKGCLISDMERIQDEYYILFCECVRKRDKAIKERDFVKYNNLVDSYAKCHEKMKQVLKFVDTL